MKRKTDNGAPTTATLSAAELVDLIQAGIPRHDAIVLIDHYARVVASAAALEAARETYARVDKVLERKPAP